MIQIDGRVGGGQLLRTALSLSAVLGEPFQIHDLRATRPQPGLKPQHVAVVSTLAEFTRAEVSGVSPGSTSVTFRPRTFRPESTSVDIGTAGSVPLLFDTLLPFAARIDGPLEVTARGGTDGKWAPTIDYIDRVRLPLLAKFDLDASVTVHATGFYPAGGGEATLRVDPSSLRTIDLTERGDLNVVEVYSKASADLEERNVAGRQAETAFELLRAREVPSSVERVEYVDARSPGSSLLLRGVYEDSLAGFDALGERGKSSEVVAEGAVRRFHDFHAGNGAVDDHMADQILIFLALSGGAVRVPEVTAHVASNLDLITRFGFDVSLSKATDGTALIEAGFDGGPPAP